MNRNYLTRIAALWMAVAIMMSGCASNPAQESASNASQPSAVETSSEANTQETSLPRQLTLEDLKAMNGGDVRYTADADGHITFLNGCFYDGTVKNLDDVEKALEGVLSLIGGDEHSALKKVEAIEDDKGYIYYTFNQWQGETAVEGAVVKAIVDPNGRTAALSSSFTPGIPAEMDTLITPEQAVEAVKNQLAKSDPDAAYTFYEDQVDRTMISTEGEMTINTLQLVYVVYTGNPHATAEETDFPYLAHYVGAKGEYLYSMATLSMGDRFSKEGANAALGFEGMTKAEYTGTVTLHDGATREITVPVMMDEDGYYLGDPDRKILLADCWEFDYGRNLAPVTSKDNTGWDDKHLLAYSNYIKAYDFYNAVGWPSCDGFGTPILILTDYCDEDRTPVDNAAYSGKQNGWQVFNSSAVNNYSETLDMIAHEYTHGFTSTTMTGILYENEYGAVNESMSDIMGNLAEMLTGSTADATWLVGENAGRAIRSMSDPNAYGQPAYVGDEFYAPSVMIPSDANDRGGVHINNSLLCGIPPKLHADGMTLEEARLLWTSVICALTPRSGYQEVHEILLFSADLNGLSSYREQIDAAYRDLRLDEKNPLNGKLKEGCGWLSLVTDLDQHKQSVSLAVFDEEKNRVGLTWPGSGMEGRCVLQIREGNYLFQIKVLDLESGEAKKLYYSGDGWSENGTESAAVSLTAGETLELKAYAG